MIFLGAIFIKIVYFGSDVFINMFTFIDSQNDILALYTYHNDEDYFNETNIVRYAHERGIPVHYEVPTFEDMSAWLDKGAELFLVAEYSSKLPVPDDARFKGINFHSSLLPEGRSYYPIECAMEMRRTYGGITAHKLFADLDRGDVIAQRRFDIKPEDDSIDVYIYCAEAALDMAHCIFDDFDAAWQNAAPQSAKLPYWRRPEAASLTLSHQMTIAQAKAIYRTYNKMTEVVIDGLRFYVDSFATGNAIIGGGDTDVVILRDDRVLYGVKDGHLRLDIQPCPIV